METIYLHHRSLKFILLILLISTSYLSAIFFKLKQAGSNKSRPSKMKENDISTQRRKSPDLLGFSQ